MAIDDREKRVAVMGVGRPWMRAVEPSADKDEEWRISVGNAYGGNALSAAAAAITPHVLGGGFGGDEFIIGG